MRNSFITIPEWEIVITHNIKEIPGISKLVLVNENNVSQVVEHQEVSDYSDIIKEGQSSKSKENYICSNCMKMYKSSQYLKTHAKKCLSKKGRITIYS